MFTYNIIIQRIVFFFLNVLFLLYWYEIDFQKGIYYYNVEFTTLAVHAVLSY